MNGQFIKEGDNLPYHGFPEPWTYRATGKRLPGLEIFFDCKMPDYQDPYYPEEAVKKLEEDWAVYLDANAMEGMLKEAAEEEEKKTKGPFDQMVPVDNGVVELPVRVSPPPESVSPFIESVAESADVGLTSDVISFGKFNEIKNNSAYSSVSNNHECTDPFEDLPIEIGRAHV